MLRTVDSFGADPLRFLPVGEGVLVARVGGFPYKVFFTVEAEASLVRIYAVMHDKRQPDYGRERVGSSDRHFTSRSIAKMTCVTSTAK